MAQYGCRLGNNGILMRLLAKHVKRSLIGIAGLGAIFAGLYNVTDGGLSWLGEDDPHFASYSVGEMRTAKLEELTAEYLSENPRGKLIVVSGDRLAPLKFLNGELREDRASWRVSIEDGQIEFREIA